MRKLLLVILTTVAHLCAYATHITGGELMYKYVGPGSATGTSRYTITLRLFRDCYSNGPLLENEQVRVGIYQNNQLYMTVALALYNGVSSMSLNTAAIPCLTGNPRVCYQIGYYNTTVDLPINENGYTLVQTSCCRIGGIANIANSTGAGATYATKIPGSARMGTGTNNSPEFMLKDTALVCAFRKFRLPFTAVDSNADSLSYSFCDAYGNLNSNNQPPPQTLTLSTLQYTGGYSGGEPLGNTVAIDAKTGVITGIAPASGRYVVAVCATEWRNGVAINEHRKDFILSVQVCDFVSADLPDPRIVCDDFTVLFENSSNSSIITSYYWTFGDPVSTNDYSTSPVPAYTYADTGIYKVKLVVKGNNGCIDSAESNVHVFPGFKVNFSGQGGCVKSPVQFADSSVAAYGTINRLQWNFGDPAISTDTASSKNPTWKYNLTGTYPVKLVAWSTKGCKDSTTKNIVMTEKPNLALAFKDTLVCGFDTLQLAAQGNGTFSWLPNNYLVNGNTATPTVFPPVSTSYTVTLNENGCIGSETVRINKISSIAVDAGKDTLVCTGDNIMLNAVSQANYYAWTPASLVVNPALSHTLSKNINTNSSFVVNARLGKCTASDSFRVVVSPYPIANAGADISICPGSKTQLSGLVVGDKFSWTPTNSMLNATTMQPSVAPNKTTSYILSAAYLTGCPKPTYDTVVVSVLPAPIAFAGNDTSIIAGQPLQLHASGGTVYRWSPPNYLSNIFVSDPMVNMPENKDTMRYSLLVTDALGCTAIDDIVITKFRTGATVFVPTGFTPNKDGKNDVLRPILAGIKKLDYFRVYNRWGQMIFETREHNKGWDGTIGGKDQNPGTYVYVLEAVDYTDKPVAQKGTVVLLR
jgi:gliding motility-associated-like protein